MNLRGEVRTRGLRHKDPPELDEGEVAGDKLQILLAALLADRNLQLRSKLDQLLLKDKLLVMVSALVQDILLLLKVVLENVLTNSLQLRLLTDPGDKRAIEGKMTLTALHVFKV